jgi:hypothetical protein
VILDDVDEEVFDDYLKSLFVAVKFVMDGVELEHSFDASWTVKRMKEDLATCLETDTLHLYNGNDIIPDDIRVTDLPDVRFRIATEILPSIEETLTILAAENSVSREFLVALRDGREIHDDLMTDDIEIKICVPIQETRKPLRDVLVDLEATVADLCKEITTQYGISGFILVSGGNPLEETEHLSGLGFPLELKATINLEFIIVETSNRFQSQFLREQTAFIAIEQMRKSYGKVRLEIGGEVVRPDTPISALEGVLIRIVPDLSSGQRVNQSFWINGRDIQIKLCSDWAIYIVRRRIANDFDVNVNDVTFKVNGCEVDYFESIRSLHNSAKGVVPIVVTLPPDTIGPRIVCRTVGNMNYFLECVSLY